jgi:hypothetical protein
MLGSPRKYGIQGNSRVELSRNGIILETDGTGSIVKRASLELIQKAWQPPLQMTIDAYLAGFDTTLRSIYVRGSVPLGQTREHVSDIDTFGIIDLRNKEIDLGWREPLNLRVKSCFPFVRDVEICAFPMTDVENGRRLAATIKTQSACVFGTDFTNELSDVKPGPDLVLDGWELPKDLAIANRAMETAKDSDEVRQVCVWAMKHLIRSGFELVMERARCYTRDLYPSYQIFATYHPEKAMAMARALALAVNPSSDCKRIKRVIDALGDWLYKKICTEYGAYRIGQILREPQSGPWSKYQTDLPLSCRQGQ